MNTDEVVPRVMKRFSERRDVIERYLVADPEFRELCGDLEESLDAVQRTGTGHRVSLSRVRSYAELVAELDAEVREYLATHGTEGR